MLDLGVNYNFFGSKDAVDLGARCSMSVGCGAGGGGGGGLYEFGVLGTRSFGVYGDFAGFGRLTMFYHDVR